MKTNKGGKKWLFITFMNEVDENTAREPRNAENIASHPIVSTIMNINLVQNI